MQIKRTNLHKKKAQLDISFGFIFGIIVIIAIIAISFYVITHFLRLSKCTQTGTFYSDLQAEVDNAWAGSIISKTFSGSLPSNIQSVCFGNLTLGNPSNVDKPKYEALIRFKNLGKNTFLYPANAACNSQLANYNLNNAKISRFFCSNNNDGKVSIKISKNATDDLVTISN